MTDIQIWIDDSRASATSCDFSDALQAVLDLHRRSQYGGCTHTACGSGSAWPCPTVEMIRDALGTDA